MSEKSPKDGKTASPKAVKKSVAGGPKSEDSPSADHPAPPDLPTANSKLQTANMEVHHHPDVEKKGFKEYLLEGLMIFIAVMMGFFAESIRENLSDHSKEHEYIIN